jgi:hypothetical protein
MDTAASLSEKNYRPADLYHRLLHTKTEGRANPVDKVRVYYDRQGNTLTVWFDDPKKESICEEVGDDVVLIKDRRGRVIGLERLNHLTRQHLSRGDNVPVEVAAV